MGKIFLSEFKQKLNKKQIKLSITVPQTKIDFEDFANRRNQIFISYLSKYLTDDKIRKGIKKINPYTVKFGLFQEAIILALILAFMLHYLCLIYLMMGLSHGNP